MFMQMCETIANQAAVGVVGSEQLHEVSTESDSNRTEDGGATIAADSAGVAAGTSASKLVPSVSATDGADASVDTKVTVPPLLSSHQQNAQSPSKKVRLVMKFFSFHHYRFFVLPKQLEEKPWLITLILLCVLFWFFFGGGATASAASRTDWSR